MKRLTGSLLLALLALLLLAAPVSAGRHWCAKDPVVALNGTAVQILVAVPAEYEATVSGPIDVLIRVPKGVEHEILFLDEGFNGYGEAVHVDAMGGAVATDGSFDVRVRVSVPVDRQLLRERGLPGGPVPLQVTVVTNGPLAWDGGLPAVVGGETLVVEGHSAGTQLALTVQGSN